MMPLLRASAVVVVGLLVAGSGGLRAQQPQQAGQGAQRQRAAANDPNRWEAAISKFEDQDKVSPPPQNAIVFIGASSIVRWQLPESFPELGAKAINRGFGGSLAPDSTRYADRIVIPYKPRIVVFYAGDNDVEANHTPQQIASDFFAFDEKVHAALPQTQIIFISIKPSLRRWPWQEQMNAANALVKDYCAKSPHRTYLDVVPQMLGADGKPKPELFVPDGLHMTPEGYKIWNAAIRPLLTL
jgi:lysophospholipase L1-like esterase